MKLPEEFTEKMRVLLKEEYPAFLASYDDERTSALRVNELKITPQAFEKIAPFPVSALPFIRGDTESAGSFRLPDTPIMPRDCTISRNRAL